MWLIAEVAHPSVLPWRHLSWSCLGSSDGIVMSESLDKRVVRFTQLASSTICKPHTFQWPQGDQRLHGRGQIGAMLRLFRQVGMQSRRRARGEMKFEPENIRSGRSSHEVDEDEQSEDVKMHIKQTQELRISHGVSFVLRGEKFQIRIYSSAPSRSFQVLETILVVG